MQIGGVYDNSAAKISKQANCQIEDGTVHMYNLGTTELFLKSSARNSWTRAKKIIPELMTSSVSRIQIV